MEMDKQDERVEALLNAGSKGESGGTITLDGTGRRKPSTGPLMDARP